MAEWILRTRSEGVATRGTPALQLTVRLLASRGGRRRVSAEEEQDASNSWRRRLQQSERAADAAASTVMAHIERPAVAGASFAWLSSAQPGRRRLQSSEGGEGGVRASWQLISPVCSVVCRGWWLSAFAKVALEKCDRSAACSAWLRWIRLWTGWPLGGCGTGSGAEHSGA